MLRIFIVFQASFWQALLKLAPGSHIRMLSSALLLEGGVDASVDVETTSGAPVKWNLRWGLHRVLSKLTHSYGVPARMAGNTKLVAAVMKPGRRCIISHRSSVSRPPVFHSKISARPLPCFSFTLLAVFTTRISICHCSVPSAPERLVSSAVGEEESRAGYL
jgi:hypothetical protein